MKSGCAAALLLLVAFAAAAQSPADSWRTIETAHFRVHYPAPYEAWARRAAERLESVRGAVSQEVGFVPPQTIDVVVTNPVAEPNGTAWPLLDTPRMIFFTEPPGPEEVIGAYGHWIDLLAVHETAHLVHMLRPSRNPLERFVERALLPLNPITLRAPRWVLEGYATVVEGRLTGAGRPGSTLRALILRRWAESGRLPSYAGMSSDRRFLGMSMAYLMGSAYLEWLEQRAGEGSLKKLWARMTARERRSFDEAFAGVYGERPERLYGEFTAELTASAMAIRSHDTPVEGALFQETPRASGDPAVSPEGARLAFVVRAKDRPEKLVVWSTGAADEEEKKFAERVKRILARDPEDVAPVRTRPLTRKPVHELVMPDGGDIRSPRWAPDGQSILFSHRAPDGAGSLHFDLYRWDFRSVRRLTRLADVRDADPMPDGRSAVAVRSRFGASQLVTIDLATGGIQPRTEPSVDVVYAGPRVSPDGARVAWIEHRGGWSVMVQDASGTRSLELAGAPSALAWRSPEELVASVSSGGFAELVRIGLAGGSTQITRTAGGAFEPAPSPDGRIFFTSLEPDGYVLRVIDGASTASPRPALDAALVPAIPPMPSAPVAFAPQTLGPSRPYGFGRQELAMISGTTLAPEVESFEAGLRMGDVVGRFDALLIGAAGNGGATRGAALSGTWRGWPVETTVHAWRVDRESAAAGDLARSGAELRGAWSYRLPASSVTMEAGADTDDRLFGSAAFMARQTRERWRAEQSVGLEAGDGVRRGMVSGALRAGPLGVRLRYEHVDGDGIALGGTASSLLPRTAQLGRVFEPALPPYAFRGDGYDGWSVEGKVPGFPVTAFYRHHQAGDREMALAGIEYRVRTDPFPILKMPALDFTAGAARLLDEPFRGETKLWLAMRWRP